MIEVSTNMKNSIQKTVDKLDYALIFIVILLFIISLFSIYSAAGQYNDDPTFYLTRQAVWFVIGLVAIVFILSLEYEHRSEEHTSELQSRFDFVCRLLLEKKKTEI